MEIGIDYMKLDTGDGKVAGIMFPLLIRLFDADGNYLTHFTTTEIFTSHESLRDENNRSYDFLKAQLDRAKMANPALAKDTPEKNGKFRAVWIGPNPQAFVYAVNADILKKAATVEVGFVRR